MGSRGLTSVWTCWLSCCVVSASRFIFWIYLFCSCIDGVLSELCIYRRSVYNVFTSSYDKIVTSTDCPWGCCYKHSSPCCPAPISLIVGCALGGVLLLALIIVAVGCCCVCRKRAARREACTTATSAASSTRSGYPYPQVSTEGDEETGATDDRPAVFCSNSSHAMEFPIPPPAYDLPPSYEEIMRGETNPAFKPDTS